VRVVPPSALPKRLQALGGCLHTAAPPQSQRLPLPDAVSPAVGVGGPCERALCNSAGDDGGAVPQGWAPDLGGNRAGGGCRLRRRPPEPSYAVGLAPLSARFRGPVLRNVTGPAILSSGSAKEDSHPSAATPFNAPRHGRASATGATLVADKTGSRPIWGVPPREGPRWPVPTMGPALRFSVAGCSPENRQVCNACKRL